MVGIQQQAPPWRSEYLLHCNPVRLVVVPRDRVRSAGPRVIALIVRRVAAILLIRRGDMQESEKGSESNTSARLGCWLKFSGRLGSGSLLEASPYWRSAAIV